MVKQLLTTPITINDISTIDNVIDELIKIKGIADIKVWDENKKLLAESKNKLEINNNLKKIDSKIKINNITIGEFTIWE